MPKRSEVRDVPRSEAKRALEKAREFVAVARAALGDKRWTGAGLAAIHGGISAADAGLIASAGVRSISKDHAAVLGMLAESASEFTGRERRHLAGLLALKNQVAYEQRLLTEAEALTLVDHATRLTRWAEGVVEAHLG